MIFEYLILAIILAIGFHIGSKIINLFESLVPKKEKKDEKEEILKAALINVYEYFKDCAEEDPTIYPAVKRLVEDFGEELGIDEADLLELEDKYNEYIDKLKNEFNKKKEKKNGIFKLFKK